jgi:DNA-binding NarL/FixJ family response regulator
MVCTIFEDDEHLFESLRSGANGYLLKADISTKFVSALSQMMDGDAPMSPRIARRVLHQLSPTPDLPVTSSILTKKELEILSLIARGFKFLEISQMQGISIHTVHSHIKNIYKKLQVTSKNEAVYEARALKLIV